MTHIYVLCDAFTYVSALQPHWQLCHKNMAGPFSLEVSFSKCRFTSSFARPTSNHSGAICAWELSCILVPTVTVESVGLTWLNHISVTWMSEHIHMLRRFGVSVWHDLFICVWFDCHTASTCDMTRSDLYPAIATMPFKSVRLRPRGRNSKRKSQLTEFTVWLVINSVIFLQPLLRKDNALRPFPGPLYIYAHNGYVSRVRRLQFLVQKLQCVHVMATICLTNKHVTCSELVTCPVSFVAGIEGHSGKWNPPFGPSQRIFKQKRPIF